MPGQKNASAYIFSGLASLYPDKPIPQVESLQPTLQWEAVAGVESYDLIICKGTPIGIESGIISTEEAKHGSLEAGEEIYYREAIGKNSHRVEEPLLPDSVYVWSVRTRTGTNVSAWSKYDFDTGMFRLTNVKERHNVWWPFSTHTK